MLFSQELAEEGDRALEERLGLGVVAQVVGRRGQIAVAPGGLRVLFAHGDP